MGTANSGANTAVRRHRHRELRCRPALCRHRRPRTPARASSTPAATPFHRHGRRRQCCTGVGAASSVCRSVRRSPTGRRRRRRASARSPVASRPLKTGTTSTLQANAAALARRIARRMAAASNSKSRATGNSRSGLRRFTSHSLRRAQMRRSSRTSHNCVTEPSSARDGAIGLVDGADTLAAGMTQLHGGIASANGAVDALDSGAAALRRTRAACCWSADAAAGSAARRRERQPHRKRLRRLAAEDSCSAPRPVNSPQVPTASHQIR